MKKITESTTMINPVPMKKDFEGNFAQKRKTGTHPGTDIPVPSGTEVKAPMDGEVVNVKDNEYPCGGTIDIDYKNGFWSRFCHIKKINVKKGDIVKQGDVVGLSGGGSGDFGKGRSTGPHLHFTLKKDGKNVDPIDYINKSVPSSDFQFKKTDDEDLSKEKSKNDLKKPDIFSSLSKKEKDELFGDIMKFIASEGIENDKNIIISEVQKIKKLMK